MTEPIKLLVSGIPAPILEWLRRQADLNERSVNKQIIFLLKQQFRKEQNENEETYQPLSLQTQSRQNPRDAQTN